MPVSSWQTKTSYLCRAGIFNRCIEQSKEAITQQLTEIEAKLKETASKLQALEKHQQELGSADKTEPNYKDLVKKIRAQKELYKNQRQHWVGLMQAQINNNQRLSQDKIMLEMLQAGKVHEEQQTLIQEKLNH